MKCHSFRIVAFCFAIVACILMASPVMAQGNGNGNGKGGGGNDGGGDDPVTYPPPPDLSVRYRVKLIPVQPFIGYYTQDVNDVGDVVGWTRVSTIDGGERLVGFCFNAYAEVLQTSDDMFASSTDWASIEFVGVNNLGAIVGRATSFDEIAYGFLATADLSSPTGWSFELLPVPENAEMLPGNGYYARKINDFGDIVGRSESETGARVFGCNPGIYDPDLFLPVVWNSPRKVDSESVLTTG